MSSDEHYPRFESGTAAALYQQIVNFSVNYLEGMLVELAHMELQGALLDDAELYAELQQKLLKRERTVRHGFQIQLEKLFTEFKTFRRSRLNANRASDWSSLGLAGQTSSRLMTTVEFVANRHTEHHSRQIFNLDRRLKSLVHRSDEPGEDQPLSPFNLCHAFLSSIDALNLPGQQTQRMFDLFDQVLEQQLDSFYKQLDLGLYHLDVMPELTDNSLFMQPSPSVEESLPEIDLAPSNDIPDVAEEQAEPSISEEDAPATDTVACLTTALETQSEPTPDAAPATRDEEETLDNLRARKLIDECLQSFRQETRNGFDNHVERFLVLHDHINPLLERNQLHTIRKFTHYYANLLSSPMLADHVANQMSRLSGVLIEMLLEDDGFFSDDAHPVQNFINSVVDFEIRCKHDGEMYARLCALIDQLVNLEQPSAASFQPIVREYEAMKTGEIQFILQQKKDQQKLEKQLKSAVLELINEITEALIVDRKTLAFFYDDWQLLLLQLGRKIGQDSDQFHQAEEIARMLAWTFSENRDTDHPDYHDVSFRSLLRAVDKGLESLGFASAHRNQVRRQLIQEFRAHQPAKQVRPLSYLDEPAEQQLDAFSSTIREHSSKLSDIQTPVRVDNRADADTLLACQLEIGAWVEIRIGAGKTFKRAKLKWKSKTRDQYIFVDQRGHKIRQLSEEELDRELADSKIKPLHIGTVPARQKPARAALLGSGFHLYE